MPPGWTPVVNGGAGRIRTVDLEFRKLLLYPSELRPRGSIITSGCKQSLCPMYLFHVSKRGRGALSAGEKLAQASVEGEGKAA